MNIEKVSASEIRGINKEDFDMAFKQIRSSVDPKDLNLLVEWNKKYGSFHDDDELEQKELT
jgi:hypothetical protein